MGDRPICPFAGLGAQRDTDRAEALATAIIDDNLRRRAIEGLIETLVRIKNCKRAHAFCCWPGFSTRAGRKRWVGHVPISAIMMVIPQRWGRVWMSIMV